MFFNDKYHIFVKYFMEIFPLDIWAVFHLSQTASDGFDQNWAKSGNLLFVILEILNALDRPIVQCMVWSLTRAHPALSVASFTHPCSWIAPGHELIC